MNEVWIMWDEYEAWYRHKHLMQHGEHRDPPFCRHCSVTFEKYVTIKGVEYPYFEQDCKHGYGVFASIPLRFISLNRISYLED